MQAKDKNLIKRQILPRNQKLPLGNGSPERGSTVGHVAVGPNTVNRTTAHRKVTAGCGGPNAVKHTLYILRTPNGGQAKSRRFPVVPSFDALRSVAKLANLLLYAWLETPQMLLYVLMVLEPKVLVLYAVNLLANAGNTVACVVD